MLVLFWFKLLGNSFSKGEDVSASSISITTNEVDIYELVNDMLTATVAAYTPTPQPTGTPQPTQAPVVVEVQYPTELPQDTYSQVARLSYYWPPLGGINADHDLFSTADGSSWIKRVEQGEKIVACPPEYPFGTRFKIHGDVWTCYDRGGAIITAPEGYIWLDMLAANMPYGLTWGVYEIVEVYK